MGWNFFCLRVFANFESLSSRLQMKLYDLKLELMTSACIQNIREVVSIFLQLTKLKSQGYNSDDIYRLLVHFKDFLSSAKKFINKWLRQREILRKSFQDKVFIFKEGKFLGKRYINQGSWKLQNCNYFLVNLFPWFFFSWILVLFLQKSPKFPKFYCPDLLSSSRMLRVFASLMSVLIEPVPFTAKAVSS